MVIVAIVDVLNVVGLPRLRKSQDEAKGKDAIATLINAARECSLSLISNSDASDYADTDGPLNTNFADVAGSRASNTTLGILSDGGTPGFKIEFTEDVPGIAGDSTKAVVDALT